MPKQKSGNPSDLRQMFKPKPGEFPKLRNRPGMRIQRPVAPKAGFVPVLPARLKGGDMMLAPKGGVNINRILDAEDEVLLKRKKNR